jgi:hypothetical protein
MPRSFSRFVLVALAAAAPLAAQGLAGLLPAGTRVDVRQGKSLRRGAVSQDRGPGSDTIKVRLDPDGTFNEVPRDSVRPAPRPASVNVGDRLEWCGQSATAFRCVPATVKGLGSGSAAGMYLMATDQFPNAPTYTKRENLWLLPAQGVPQDTGLATGRFRCFAYNDKGIPSLLGILELRADGTYSENGKPGRYSYSTADHMVIWVSGPAKDQGWLGKAEGNAAVRIRSNVLCSRE